MFRKAAPLMLILLVVIATVASAAPNFDRFQAMIGIDDGAKGRSGEGIFRINVDGKEVFKSGTLLPGQPPKPVDVSIAGAKELTLYIDDEGDGHGGDWGDWLDARLVDSKTGEVLFLTDLIPEEKAWIACNKNRNIVNNKLSVDGKVYARGWGGISGNEMVFKNWDKVAADREAAINKKNTDAASRLGKLALVCDALPQGLKILLDGKTINSADLKKGIAISASSVITITTNPTDKAHIEWWKTGNAKVVVGSRSIPLIDLVQPTDRIIHKNIHPNRNVLTGKVIAGPQIYWAGQPLPPAGPITFDLRDIPLSVERASIFDDKASGKLLVRAKEFKTTEIPDPEAVTSAVLTVAIDDKPVAYVFSDNKATWTQSIAIKDWPNKLQCITSSGADGSMADGFSIDLGVQLPGMTEPLWLRSVQPSYSKFDYREAKRLLMAGTWELPGSGEARWDNLSAELTARKAGQDALPAAIAKIKAVKDSTAINAAIDEVLKLDPKQPDIRMAAAARYKELGDLDREREQWGLIAEASRADLALIQKARIKNDEIWDKMDPAPFVYPDDNVATRNSRMLGKRWDGKGEFLGKIWTITIDQNKQWTDNLQFTAPKTKRFAILVNSLGVEVKASLASDGKIIAEKTAKHPMLDIDMVKSHLTAGTPLTLTVSLEPDVTGLILTHSMEVAAWAVTSDADIPTEEWNIALNNDGSAVVSRTSKAPVFAAIPRTATQLKIEGTAGYTIQEPITEYLVQWDGRLGETNLPLLAMPAPGQTLKISYYWPDAAYNVAVSRQNWSERKDKVFMQTPPAIIDTDKKSVWRITNIPNDWVNTRYTPEPINEDKNLFLVDPKGGLGAEWKASDVMTPWIVMSYKNLNMYVPDNPNNRRWFPVWMKYVKIIYDREVHISGFENPFYIYIAPTGPGQLSGYGGATVADPNASETWIAATGRMAPCLWRHGSNVTGVDAHELHWINGNCMALTAPTWATEGFGCWLEQSGWEASCLADAYKWRMTRLASIKPYLETVKQLGYNPIQTERPDWEALPNDTKVNAIHLGWYIVDELAKKYGDDFWAKFWAEEKKLTDVYAVLSSRAKQILFVDELVRFSKDPTLRDRFVNEWLFDLTPDPQDASDRFLLLPHQPSVTTEDKSDYCKLDFDDKYWAAASGPGSWDEKVPGLKGYSGTIWYRYTFDVPADFKDENLELILGKIAIADETYLNGVKIGSTGKFPPDTENATGTERVYKIKSGILKPGQRNVVAIRVFSNSSGGGITERPRLISRLKK